MPAPDRKCSCLGTRRRVRELFKNPLLRSKVPQSPVPCWKLVARTEKSPIPLLGTTCEIAELYRSGIRHEAGRAKAIRVGGPATTTAEN